MSRGRWILIAIALVLGAMLTALLNAVGVSLPFAIAWGMLVVVAFTMARREDFSSGEAWPPPVAVRPQRGSEAVRLSWSYNLSRDTVGHAARVRVIDLVAIRMQRLGLNLDDPAHRIEIDRLLGSGLLAAIEQSDPRRKDIDRALDALDRLELKLQEERTS